MDKEHFLLRDSFRLRVVISLLPSDLPTRPFVVRLASARFLVSFRRFRAYVSFVRRLAYLFVSFRSTQTPPRFQAMAEAEKAEALAVLFALHPPALRETLELHQDNPCSLV